MHPKPAPSGGAARLPRRRRAAGLVRVVGISAAVLLVAAGAIWAVTRDGGESAEMRAVSAVDLGRVEIGSFPINTTAMGELEARNQIELRSMLDTRADIVEIVPEGAVVKKGDLLVQLNAEELQDQIDQQTLEVERAEADVIAAENSLKIQLSQNESQERAAQLKIDLADLALAQWREGEVVETRAKQKLEVEEAEEDLVRLKEKYDRSIELEAKGFLSTDELKSDKISYNRAVSRLEIAKLDQVTYDEFQYPRDEKTKISDLEEAKADFERVKTQNEINAGAKQSSLETTRRQFELKAERLQKLQEQFGLAAINAPTDGLVVYATSIGRGRDMVVIGGDGPLQIGREVRPNEQLIILPDTSSMVATVRVHESLAGRIRPGQRASIKIDAITGEMFYGTVESVGVLAESGGWRDPNRREYSVRVAIDHDNSDGKLKPSMRAEAEIMLGAVQDSPMVPVQAVFTDGPVKFVYRPKASRYERVPIQVGRMSDTYAQVLAGLDEGERVLLREPTPGEVASGEWTRAQLETAGVALDENGKPVVGNARADMMRQMMETGGMPDGATIMTIPAGGADAAAQVGGRTGFQRPGGPEGQGGRQGGRPGGDGQRPQGAGPDGRRGGEPQTTGTQTTEAAPAENKPADTTPADAKPAENTKEAPPAQTDAPPAQGENAVDPPAQTDQKQD
ncbi:MAG: efflux RND transporter periplasmic adaptor subunit [Phycisphaerales bacterium]|nr:efflux RND transporter periplasmic adaptor subunit [Phycisphaerales bacterium]